MQPHRERRSDLPTRQCEGEVPGDDRADDARRFAGDQGERVGRGVRRLVGELVGQLPVPAEGVDRGTQFDVVRVRDRLTHLQADRQCQPVTLLLQHIGDPQQDPAPVGRCEAWPRPRIEGPARGGHGGVHLGSPGVGHVRQHLPVAGRDCHVGLSAPGFVGAVDVVRAGQVQCLGAAQPFVVGDVQHAWPPAHSIKFDPKQQTIDGADARSLVDGFVERVA